MLTKIISGGQTGADLGALRAARELGLATGGWAPKGFVNEKGSCAAAAQAYGLTEHSVGGYAPRTLSNVMSADAVLLFGLLASAGTALTRTYALRYAKPFYEVPWRFAKNDFPQLCDVGFNLWLDRHEVRTLLVAGNRESKNPGVEDAVRYYLLVNLRHLVREKVKA